MANREQPTFKINPHFRLTTKYLSVKWHCIDDLTLQCEASIEISGRYVCYHRNKARLLAQYSTGIIDFIFTSETDFESKSIQKWLRLLMRDIILMVAKDVLPKRVQYWEQQKGLKGTGVSVKRLRKNVLGYCTHYNHIVLQPFLVIFKPEWMDGVILHEIAHYKHKHHRKSFWDFLSTLLGQDSRFAKVKDDIAMNPYYEYYLYLTKN